MAEQQDILRMDGIVKKFGDLVANDNVTFHVRRGEIHALVGENGAGKSTLMNVLSGVLQPDEGNIWFDGADVEVTDPICARKLGIGMVFQHFMLIQNMTVAENIMLSMNPRGLSLPFAKTRKMIQEFSEKYSLDVDPDKKVSELSVGQQQRVEILKVLCANIKLLILDEPTAVLTPDETSGLFKIIRRLVDEEDHTVIFITHKLKEVMAICDRITVLRLGQNVAVVNKNETTVEDLGNYMVGRRISMNRLMGNAIIKNVALSLKKVKYKDRERVLRLNIDGLEVRSGEILGIAGVDGNGQAELAHVCCGLIKPDSGSVTINGNDMTGKKVIDYMNEGVSYIPEDGNRLGLVSEMGIHENLVVKNIRQEYSSSKGWKINHSLVENHAREMVDKYDIRCSSVTQPIRSLSGGNQQKVILAREMESNPKVLIAVHPTRGVDLGASDYIHSQLVLGKENGCAILLISADLDEIIRLSDRMAIMFEGSIIGYEDPANPDYGKISLKMAGKGDEE